MTAKKSGENLTDTLDKLSKIVDWFESQQEIDVEVGLEKVREAATLIRSSKSRLADINNEFKEIEKEIRGEIAESTAKGTKSKSPNTGMTFPVESPDPDGIPF